MAFLVKGLFSWNECLKNGDISIFDKFLVVFFPIFFLNFENLCQILSTCQVSDQVDH